MKGPHPGVNLLTKPQETPPHILVDETLAVFGWDCRFFKPSSQRLVIVRCVLCSGTRQKPFRYGIAQTTCTSCANTKRSRDNAPQRSEKMKAYYATGGRHGMTGRTHTPAVRAILRDFALKRGCSPEMLAQLVVARQRRGPLSEETRAKLRGRLGPLSPNYGRKPTHAKKTWVRREDGTQVCMRSTWEAAVANWLTARNLAWEYEPQAIPVTYVLDGITKEGTYRPDFWLPETKEWIEVKGRWLFEARAKYDAFLFQYPEQHITLADRRYLKERNLIPPRHPKTQAVR